MSRYIDADELRKDGWKLNRQKHGIAISTFETMELDCVPTADVVEVVRCKNCKYYEPDGVCANINFLSVRPNDYCSYAEKV